MANLAVALKEEMCRLARKEIKAQTGTMKQAVARYRREIARLKRQLAQHEKKIAVLANHERKRLEQPEIANDTAEGVRFSPRSVKTQRARTGLSAADYGRLVGVSSLTIYNWELGKFRPGKEQLAALVALRGMGKREALAKLELMKAGEKKTVSQTRRTRRKK